MTRVVNIRKDRYDVFIGRGSPWGNPYRIGPDGDRADVILKYIEYAIRNDWIMSHLKDLKGKTLGCYCKPLACHGDWLAQMAELT